MTTISTAPLARPDTAAFLGFGAIAAIVASTAAVASLQLGLAPWVMFIGWVAYFKRPTSANQAVRTGLCVLGGLVFGAISVLAVQALTPIIGTLAYSRSCSSWRWS